MLENYIPILIFFVVATFFSLGLLVVGYLLSPKRPDKEKVSAYECGFAPFEDARMKFDIRYYLVAVSYTHLTLPTIYSV